MRRLLVRHILPWTITSAALFFVFRGLDWQRFVEHLRDASVGPFIFATVLTAASYFIRARRWQLLLPSSKLSFYDSYLVLVLGFFMNNLLPARAGEFIRAHAGSRVTGESRTFVLASVASERLADGLTLSLMFVAFALNLSSQQYSDQLLYVAAGFILICALVILALLFRKSVFRFLARLEGRSSKQWLRYLISRGSTFLAGLEPLCRWPTVAYISLWSILIWSIELLVFMATSHIYGVNLSTSMSVLFMVAANFSSLIPAAPGALGVIEVIATAVLVSSGGLQREEALTMVLTQHVIQFSVIAIAGCFAFAQLKKRLGPIQTEQDSFEPDGDSSEAHPLKSETGLLLRDQ